MGTLFAVSLILTFLLIPVFFLLIRLKSRWLSTSIVIIGLALIILAIVLSKHSRLPVNEINVITDTLTTIKSSPGKPIDLLIKGPKSIYGMYALPDGLTLETKDTSFQIMEPKLADWSRSIVGSGSSDIISIRQRITCPIQFNEARKYNTTLKGTLYYPIKAGYGYTNVNQDIKLELILQVIDKSEYKTIELFQQKGEVFWGLRNVSVFYAVFFIIIGLFRLIKPFEKSYNHISAEDKSTGIKIIIGITLIVLFFCLSSKFFPFSKVSPALRKFHTNNYQSVIELQKKAEQSAHLNEPYILNRVLIVTEKNACAKNKRKSGELSRSMDYIKSTMIPYEPDYNYGTLIFERWDSNCSCELEIIDVIKKQVIGIIKDSPEIPLKSHAQVGEYIINLPRY
jgi:hypothetical protein